MALDWARFVYVEWCGKYAKIWSGGRFYEVLGDRTTTNVFERNYLISLREPPIDLRQGVHLKHHNLIS